MQVSCDKGMVSPVITHYMMKDKGATHAQQPQLCISAMCNSSGPVKGTCGTMGTGRLSAVSPKRSTIESSMALSMMVGIGGRSMSEGSMAAGVEVDRQVARLDKSTSEGSRHQVAMLVGQRILLMRSLVKHMSPEDEKARHSEMLSGNAQTSALSVYVSELEICLRRCVNWMCKAIRGDLYRNSGRVDREAQTSKKAHMYFQVHIREDEATRARSTRSRTVQGAPRCTALCMSTMWRCNDHRR
jgi:hypothetical protein